MAAHGLNILYDFVKMVGEMGHTHVEAERFAYLKKQMTTALNYAPGLDTPIVGPEDWSQLLDAVLSEEPLVILQVLAELIPAVEAEWERLDMPITMEEWREKHYESL